MSSSSSTSTISAEIRSMIKDLLEDGLSNREIATSINKMRRDLSESSLSIGRITEIVNTMLDDENDADNECAAPAPKSSPVSSKAKKTKKTGKKANKKTKEEVVCISDSDESEHDDDSTYVPESEVASETASEADSEEEMHLIVEDDASEASSVESSAETESTCDYDTTIPSRLLNDSARISFYHEQPGPSYYDTIRIKCVYTNTFHVHSFYDRNNNSDINCLQAEWYGTAVEVKEYLDLVMKMTAYDQQPFGEMEVSIPHFPLVSFIPRTMRNKNRRNMIVSALDQWMADASMNFSS